MTNDDKPQTPGLHESVPMPGPKTTATHDDAHGHEHDHADHGDLANNSHDHGHAHGHGHGHAHGHAHAHDGSPFGHSHSTISNIKLALFINLSFSLIEIVGGVWSGSVAVLSNAVHDLGDALALGLAYIMELSANKQANPRYSYGYRRLSLLSALFTCAVLVAAAAIVLARAVPLLMHPETPKLDGMAGFAVIGVVVNAYAAWRLSRGKTMNERVASWHMVEDVLGWASVLIGSVAMMFFDLPIIDPLLSIFISMFILWGVARNLYQTLRLFLQATPEGFDLALLRREIEQLAGVAGTHDAHLWSLDGQSHVLTIHVVVADDAGVRQMDEIKKRIRELVARRGDIHVTVEMEAEGAVCAVNCGDPGARSVVKPHA